MCICRFLWCGFSEIFLQFFFIFVAISFVFFCIFLMCLDRYGMCQKYPISVISLPGGFLIPGHSIHNSLMRSSADLGQENKVSKQMVNQSHASAGKGTIFSIVWH
jgi:hypothetical protein